MARICEICGKSSINGNIIWRRGKPKRQGGIGQHVTAVTRRRFMPNIQKVRALVGGNARAIKVCGSCLKAGKIVKAPHGYRKSQTRLVAAD